MIWRRSSWLAGDKAEQELGAHHPPDFPESPIETVLPGVVAELAQQRGGKHLASADRGDHPHDVAPVGLYEIPVDRLVTEHRLDVLVDLLLVRPEEGERLPVPYAGHELYAQSVG